MNAKRHDFPLPLFFIGDGYVRLGSSLSTIRNSQVKPIEGFRVTPSTTTATTAALLAIFRGGPFPPPMTG